MWKAALELATAFIDENSRGDTKRALSRLILNEYMPEPVPEDFRSIATLTATLLALLQRRQLDDAASQLSRASPRFARRSYRGRR